MAIDIPVRNDHIEITEVTPYIRFVTAKVVIKNQKMAQNKRISASLIQNYLLIYTVCALLSVNLQGIMDKLPCIAIIGDNTLMVLGLRGLIEAMMPTIEVFTYTTVSELHAAEAMGKHFFHYFVMARTMMSDMAFFIQRHQQTIVLTDSNLELLPAEFRTLNMSQSEPELVRALMLMQHHGHKGRSVPQQAHPHPLPPEGRSKAQQRQAEVRQWMGHAPAHPSEAMGSHPHILDLDAVRTTSHGRADKVVWVRMEGCKRVVCQGAGVLPTELHYQHPDILPPTGASPHEHRPVQRYAQSTLHPDIIDVDAILVDDPDAMHDDKMPPEGGQALRPSSLTKREREVLVLIVKGYINKEIATHLNIGLTTVISHRHNLISKLGIRSISGLTIYAVTHGLVSIEEIEEQA